MVVSYGNVTGPLRSPPPRQIPPQSNGGPSFPTLKTVPQWPPGNCNSLGMAPLDTFGCSDQHSMSNQSQGVAGWWAAWSLQQLSKHSGVAETQRGKLKYGALVQACWEASCNRSTGRLHPSSRASLPPTQNHAPHIPSDILVVVVVVFFFLIGLTYLPSQAAATLTPPGVGALDPFSHQG